MRKKREKLQGEESLQETADILYEKVLDLLFLSQSSLGTALRLYEELEESLGKRKTKEMMSLINGSNRIMIKDVTTGIIDDALKMEIIFKANNQKTLEG